MTLALNLAQGEAAAPFAAVDILYDFEAARPILTSIGPHSAYQTPAYLDAWARAFDTRLAIAVARDARGEAVAALALHVVRLGPLRIARLAGESWANCHLGLFREPALWRSRDIRAMLRAAGRTLGVDLFAFMHSPAEGRANPLLALEGTPSPSPGLATRLGTDAAEWLDAHFSRATQKKLRKKWKKLEAFGPVVHRRAANPQEALRFLDAMFAHKAEQSQARGEPDPLADPAARELLRRLVAGDAPPMETHALLAGGRIVAVMGALGAGERLSALVISHDGDEQVAAATPGLQLSIEVARDARARGFETMDFGVGDARYKREICEIEERLRDLAFGVTLAGRVAAPLYLALRALMRAIKKSPAWHARARTLVHLLKRMR